MTDHEWFYIQQDRQERKQKQGVKKLTAFPCEDKFTLPDGVPIVSVNDEEDDLNEEKE
jgi:hypothetical protein